MNERIQRGLKRILFAAIFLWILSWVLIGLRGIKILRDAYQFIDSQPAGAKIPKAVLSALESGQAYVFYSVILGLVLPAFSIIVWWFYSGFKRKPKFS